MSGEAAFTGFLKRMAGGEALSAKESADAFAAIMRGTVPEMQMAALLTALAIRKPTIAEITGAVQAMRGAMLSIKAPPGAIDMCGTGGDGHGTLNVSTAASFVVAGSGVPVAKHGNRNMSSRTGAADVLEALGITIDVPPAVAERALAEANLCFLFAQSYHPAMKHVGPVRRALGFRTIFNLLGPLSNPARVKRQLIGVFSEDWVSPVVEVLAALDTEAAWVVHGSDGMDELSTTAPTHAAMLADGRYARQQVDARAYGFPPATLAQLKGGTAEENARAIHHLLDGEEGPFRDIVLLNAGAALVVAGKVEELRDGIATAAEAIDSGAARQALEQLRACTQGVRA
jgi:anthranilate phosphoribosyltransferase